MSYAFSKRTKMLSITTFLIGIIMAGAAFSVNLRTLPPVGFTITLQETFTPNDGGKPFVTVLTVRYQKSEGSWKEISTYHKPDGTIIKRQVAFAQNGRGVFQVDEKNKVLIFISSKKAEVYDPAKFDQHNNPRFVREDSVAGYKTQVLRFPEDTGSGYTEIHLAPALQNLPIKEIHVSDQGTAIMEPVKIEIGEPSESVFGSLPNWPVNYDRFKEKIKTMEDAGRHEVAEEMRLELQQQLVQKPE